MPMEKSHLSLAFLHKPSRASSELDKATTRHNSLANRYSDGGLSPQVSPSSSTHSGDTDELMPRLVRKKSGEVVKSVIRADVHHRRVKSMPSTPTYKSVHFGVDTDVKYFKQRDRPSAISNPNSPEISSSDEEGSIDDIVGLSLNNRQGDTKFPTASNWSIELVNFPSLSYTKRFEDKCPVFLERVFISIDRMSLIGHVAVRNLAFQKSVTVRYSLDNWLTIIELPAKYSEPPDILGRNNYDRFIFDIPLESLYNSFHISSGADKPGPRAYEFCLKYCTADGEYWDNNNSKNYRLILNKVRQVNPGSASLTGKHTTAPRYSSSYLKRRASHPHISQLKKSSAEAVTSGPEHYVDEPLYSMYQHSDSSPSPTLDAELVSELAVGNNELQSSQKPQTPSPHQLLNHSHSDPKSYKELLENYCFFNPEEDGDSQSSVKPFSVHTFLHS